MATTKPKSCKDCGSTTRKLPYPGPRCTTCHRVRKKATRASAHSLRVLRDYNLAPGEYDALYEAQGGMCYTCGPWTGNRGLSKKLSVDHDHSCCPKPPTCGKCTRGLICSRCNSLIGEVGDSAGHAIDRLKRYIDYLQNPPAQELLRIIREQRPID
jgi:hypothetical protein